MGLIPEEVIAQIIDRCDIVEIISAYVPLKRAGRNFKGQWKISMRPVNPFPNWVFKEVEFEIPS